MWGEGDRKGDRKGAPGVPLTRQGLGRLGGRVDRLAPP